MKSTNNVFEYLKEYGALSFREKPFGEVDSLILSQFCYLKVDGMVPGIKEEGESVSLQLLAEHPEREKMFADERFARNNRELFELLVQAKRFEHMCLNYYVNIVDEDIETQFSAMTIFLEGGRKYIAFRGTDETIVGWKEDFSMAFSKPIPSQEYSVIYVTQVAERIQGRFMLGGHSKGGNLAVYAALQCPEALVERIRKVYSFDGPGFRPEVLDTPRYDVIKSRLRKYIPQSSLIGMVLQNHGHYHVVKSSAVGILQHDPYTWQVSEGRFLHSDTLYRRQKLMDHVINRWILDMDEEQMHRFVENLFGILYASETDNLIDFEADRKKSLHNMIEAIKEMSADEKKFMKKIVGRLFQYMMKPE